MKGLVTKKLRAGLSLFLAAVMAFSTPCSALAVEDAGEETINYVSLGDSMANGYGFVGYHQNSNDRNVYDLMTGKGMYGEGAYPLQFEKYLTEQGYEVNHTKLATSAMLAEDLLFLLDGREEFDDGWNGFKDYVGTYSIEELKAHFQKAITEADIMTMGIGNASFGAFMLDRVTNALGVMGGSLEGEPVLNFEEAIAVLEMDDEQHALAMEIYNTLLEKLVENVPEDIVEEFNLKEVVDIVAYTVAAYLVNNTLLMDKIIEMNPDAEIVLVGLLNTTYGMNITDEAGNVLVPFGDTMDFAFDALNAYMAGLPAVKQAQGEWKDAKFYFAEQPNPLFICQEFENLSNNGWGDIQDGRLSGATVRQRNIDAFNGSLSEIMGAPFAAGINAAVPGVVKDMLAEMYPGWNDLNDATQQELINATIAEKNLLITEETHGENYKYFLPNISLADVENFEDNQPAEFVAGGNFNVDENRKNLAIALYLGIERGVAESTDTLSIPLEGLIAIATNIETAFDGFSTNLESPVSVAQEMGDYLTTGDVLKGMCKVYGLFKVGNGMSVHPTPEGHDKIAASVIDAYANGHTAADETVENLKVVAGLLADLIAEYGDDAAAYAYNYAKENGYIEMAEKALAELEAQLVILKAEAEKLAGEAKVEAEKLIAEAEKALAELHALLEAEAKEFTQNLINQIEKQLDILEENVKALVEIMIEEGTEAAKKAAEDALAALDAFSEATLEKFQEALKVGAEWLLEKADTAYAEFVEAAKAAVEKYAPEAADAMYDWLYNNPEKVIGFFEEYGDDIVNFLVENGEPIVMVLGYLALTYGDEVVDFVVSHPEALLALVDWYKENGDNMWALIDVYAKELGFYDLIKDVANDVIEDIKNIDVEEALNNLYDLLKTYGPDALKAAYEYADEQGYIEDLKAYAEELIAYAKAELENYAEEVRPQIEAAIKELEDQLAALEAELAAKKAELESLIAELEAYIEAKKEELENASAEVKAQIEATIAEIEHAIEVLENTIAMIEKQIEVVKASIEELNAELAKIAEDIEALVAAAEEAYDAITNFIGILRGEIEGDIEDAYEAIVEAIEVVKDAVNYVQTLAINVNATLENVAEFVKLVKADFESLSAFVNEAMAEAIAVIEAVMEKIDEAAPVLAEVKAVLEAIIETVGYIADFVIDVTEAFDVISEKVNAFINEMHETVDPVVAQIADCFEKIYADGMACINMIAAYAEALIEKAEIVMNRYNNEVKPMIEAAIAELEAQLAALEAELAALKAELCQKLAELKELMETVKDASGEVLEEIEKAIAEIENAIAALESAIAEIEKQIEAVKAAIAELKAEAERIVAEIEAMVEAAVELNEAIKEMLAIAAGEIQGNIEEAIAKVKEAVACVESVIEAVNEAVDNTIAFAEEIIAAIEGLQAQIEAQIEAAKAAIEAAIENAIAELNAAIENANEELKAMIEEAKAALEAKAEEVLAELDAAVVKLATDVLTYAAESLKDLAETLYVNIVDLVELGVESVKAYLEEAYIEATTAAYVIGEDSLYVALGDTSTTTYGLDEEATSYVEKFANELGVDFENLNAVDLEKEDMSPVGCIDVVAENAETIADADLITLGFSGNTFVTFAIEQILKAWEDEGMTEYDWAACVTEHGVPYVEEAFAEIHQKFLEAGLDEAFAEIMTYAVESYAYSYAQYLCGYPELINAIREVNDDALIIIVGMYNPLKDAVIDLGTGEGFAIGEYLDYLVELTDVHATGYAMLTGEAIFVEAEDVEINAAATELSIEQLIMEYFLFGGESMHASEAGHEYIKDQLIGALTVTEEEVAEKEEQEAPERPAIAKITATSIIVEAVDGMEYSIDGGKTWSSTGVFEGLNPSYTYEVIARKAETDTHKASEPSEATIVKLPCSTDAPGEFCPSKKFTDVNFKKWYHPHVDYCVENGLIYGTSDTTFSPNDDITRGMIVSILYRLSNEKVGSAEVAAMTFTDVNPSKYYAKAIAWAQMNGVVYGTSETTFEPEEAISREQMITIIYRYAKHMGMDTSAREDLTRFPDHEDVKAWAKTPLEWACAEGLFYGAQTSAGTYKINANDFTTRAEATSFVYRFCMMNAQ